MSEVTLQVVDNGPILINGPVRLLDGQGKELKTEGTNKLALCRCGKTNTAPFCDGSHKQCGFQSAVRAE